MPTVQKSEKVQVVSTVMEWQGGVVLDIRTYVVAAKGPSKGQFIPTAKGAQIPIEKAEAFLRDTLSEVRHHLGGNEAPKKRPSRAPANERPVTPKKPLKTKRPSVQEEGFFV